MIATSKRKGVALKSGIIHNITIIFRRRGLHARYKLIYIEENQSRGENPNSCELISGGHLRPSPAISGDLRRSAAIIGGHQRR
jgi:hypothetical protein